MAGPGKMGRQTYDTEKEKQRFQRWAEQLGCDFDPRAFDDLVATHGPKQTIEDFEKAFIAEWTR
jgi:hypothetical protein